MAKAAKYRLYIQKPDGSWAFSLGPFDTKEAAEAELRRVPPSPINAVWKVAARKPHTASTPAQRAIDRAKAAPAPRKKKERNSSQRAKGVMLPSFTENDGPYIPHVQKVKPNTGVRSRSGSAKAQEYKAAGITPQAERDKWPAVKQCQLDRQHHKLNDEECMDVIDALGGQQQLIAATASRFARPSHEGTLIVDLIDGNRKLDGHTVACLDVVATGKDTYDVRILELRIDLKGDALHSYIAAIPDANYIGGGYLIKTISDVTKDDMLAKIKEAGLDISTPMSPVELLKRKAKAVTTMFELCPCPECETARIKAKANGTDLVSERLAMEPADGGFAHLKTELAPVLDPQLVNKPEDKKLREALKRSTLVTTEPSGTKH